MTMWRAAALQRVPRWLAILLLAGSGLITATPARGDGGTLQKTLRTRTLEINIFTDPTPPRTGTVDVNVVMLPIPAGTSQALPAFQVCAYPDGAPEKIHCDTPVMARAMNYRAGQLDLPKAGLWHVEVRVEADVPITGKFDLNVEEGYPAALTYAVWIALPAVAAWMFMIHRRRVNRRQRITTAPASHTTIADKSQGGS
jgi:hypothetical protein